MAFNEAMAEASSAAKAVSVRNLKGRLQFLIWQHASAKDVVAAFRELADALSLEESQLAVLRCITVHPLGDEFIPPRSYLRQVLKSVLASLEETCATGASEYVLDELYALYTALLSAPEPKVSAAYLPKEDKLHLPELPGVCSASRSEQDATGSDRQGDGIEWAEEQPEDGSAAHRELSWVCERCAGLADQGPSLLSGVDCTEFCLKTFEVSFPRQASQASLLADADSTAASVDEVSCQPSVEQGRDCTSAAGPESAGLPGRRISSVDQVGGESLEAGQRLIVLRVTRNLLQGGTGCHLWPASFFLADVLLSNPHMVAGRTVLELGSGCGLTGLCASLLPPHAAPSTVVLSDGNDETLSNLVQNLRINGVPIRHPPAACASQQPLRAAKASVAGRSPEVFCLKLRWGVEEASCLKALRPDVLLGADIIYDKSVIPDLLALLALLLGDDREGKDGRREDEALPRCLDLGRVPQDELDVVLRPPFALLASVVRDKGTQDEFVSQARALGLNIVVAESLSPRHHFSFLQRDACEPMHLYILTAS